MQDLTYNEALATVLRGVQIDSTAGAQLGVAPGYYQLSEFRVSGQPADHVITLEIEKGYGECVDPSKSILPRSSDPWVFSQITSYTYNATHYQETAADWYGHVLSFDIMFGPSCNTTTGSTLSGLAVGLTTKSYTTDIFNTCGWSSEPPLTGPSVSCL